MIDLFWDYLQLIPILMPDSNYTQLFSLGSIHHESVLSRKFDSLGHQKMDNYTLFRSGHFQPDGVCGYRVSGSNNYYSLHVMVLCFVFMCT
jgi:hypothetical protein